MTKAEEFRQYADKRNKEMNIVEILFKNALREIDDASCRGKYKITYFIDKDNYNYIKPLKKKLKENGFKVSFLTGIGYYYIDTFSFEYCYTIKISW